MSLLSKIVVSLGVLSTLSTGLNITCPILQCAEGALEGNKCFQHDGSAPTRVLKGGLCFDIEKEPITALPYFCPFELQNKEYAWVEEYLQAQEGKDLNMKCKPEESRVTRNCRQLVISA